MRFLRTLTPWRCWANGRLEESYECVVFFFLFCIFFPFLTFFFPKLLRSMGECQCDYGTYFVDIRWVFVFLTYAVHFLYRTLADICLFGNGEPPLWLRWGLVHSDVRTRDIHGILVPWRCLLLGSSVYGLGIVRLSLWHAPNFLNMGLFLCEIAYMRTLRRYYNKGCKVLRIVWGISL